MWSQGIGGGNFPEVFFGGLSIERTRSLSATPQPRVFRVWSFFKMASAIPFQLGTRPCRTSVSGASSGMSSG